jgi:hypothetical protein
VVNPVYLSFFLSFFLVANSGVFYTKSFDVCTMSNVPAPPALAQIQDL